MSFLEQPGDLAEVPLAAVLIEALNQRATGVLTVEHDGGSSRVFIRDGTPVGAQSYTGFKPLGQILLAAGLIDMDALGKSLAEMAKSGRPQGEVLVELGAVTTQQVDEALSEQQANYLTVVAGLASGKFLFAHGDVPAWTAGIKIAPLKAIVQALERPQAMPLVVSALQPATEGALALAPGYQQLAKAFGWSDAEAGLVKKLQGTITLDAFFESSTVPSERSRAIIAALLLLGLASPQAGPVTAEAEESGVVDLADLAGVPMQPVAAEPVAPAPAPIPAAPQAPQAKAAPPSPPPPPGRRSDPEEARKRRQRLLQRAMHNMGVGPLSGQAPAAGARPSAGEAAPEPAKPAKPAAPTASAKPTAAEGELRKVLENAMPRAKMTNFFDRLGLSSTANLDQVKSAYFNLAKQLHPDRFGTPGLVDLAPKVKEVFLALNEAYETLSDARKRAEYVSRAQKAGEVSEADRESAAADFKKGEAAGRTRDFSRARGFFEAALKADPKPEYHLGYGAVLMQEPGGDRARAKTQLEAAMRGDPACVERATVLLALHARDEGSIDQAEKLLKRVLQANPRCADAERELRLLEQKRAQKPAKASGLSGLFRKR